jgi:hypothetical protein
VRVIFNSTGIEEDTLSIKYLCSGSFLSPERHHCLLQMTRQDDTWQVGPVPSTGSYGS